MKARLQCSLVMVLATLTAAHAQVAPELTPRTNELVDLMARFLPGYIAREVTATNATSSRLQLIRPDGTVVPDVPLWKQLDPHARVIPGVPIHTSNPQLNAILRDMKTVINSQADATDVARLVWIIAKEGSVTPLPWATETVPIERGWRLKILRIGPPRRVNMRVHNDDLEILVDERSNFLEVRQVFVLPRIHVQGQ